ncbi:MAG: nucleotidyl transferase [Acidobacteria bacterium]|nr:MAG: nucleotidyl transferase [Acidobacteriota bacterium]
MAAQPELQRQKGDGFARAQEVRLEPDQMKVYSEAVRILNQVGVQYVLSGAFALHAYTGLWRNTKDLDVFIRPADVDKALGAFAKAGYKTEILESHWLSKAHRPPYFVDLIFGMANGRVTFDDDFVQSERTIEVAGEPAPLMRLEELIVSKIYIAVRDRFDGGDIAHLIRSAEGKLDWARIVKRLGQFRSILLWHLIFFNFVYPGHSSYLPKDLMTELFEDLRQSWSSDEDERVCFGTLLDSFSFAADVHDWGYTDARDLRPYYQRKGKKP